MFRSVLVLSLIGGLAHAESITLDEALRRASTRPSVAMATAERDAARANTADLPLYNPTLELSAGPRWASGTTLAGGSIGVGQTIELGGKRAARRDAAAARAKVATGALVGAKLAARIEAWRAFQLAVVARMRVAAAIESEQTAAEVVGAIQQAQALGGETQLRLNLAVADLGKAKHDRIDGENEYATTLADLGSAVGAPAAAQLEPDVTSPALPRPVDEARVVAAALAQRPELAQAQAEIEAARAEIRVADAAAVPDVTLGLTYGYEPDPDLKVHTLVVSAAIALPVRTRNQAQRAASRALAQRADLEAGWLRVEVERTVRTAAQRYTRALAAVEAFDREVSDKLHDNLQLAADSYRAGKIDFYAFSLARRDLFANRLGYLDAAGEAIEAWAALARASGVQP